MKNIKRCIYCGAIAKTRDHVPPKCILHKPFPNNLLTVPCCLNCNNKFSKDEEYILHVLITMGTSPILLDKQKPGGQIDRALFRDSYLYDRIIDSLSVGENNSVYLIPEQERIETIALKISLGIYYERYKQVRQLNEFKSLGTYSYNIENQIPYIILLLTLTERFTQKKWSIVQKDVFSYIIVRNWQNNKLIMILNFHSTLWSCIEIKPPRRTKTQKISKNQIKLFS